MVGLELELGLAGMAQALDIGERSDASFTAHVFTGVITLLIVVSLSIWGRGAWKIACTLLGLACGAIVGWTTGILEPATLQHAPWLAVPHPVLFDLSFDVALAPAFLASGLAAGLRASGGGGVGTARSRQQGTGCVRRSRRIPATSLKQVVTTNGQVTVRLAYGA